MNKKRAMGWFIVFLMVFSVLGIIGGGIFGDEGGNKVVYNNLEFWKENNLWRLKSGGNDYYFQYLPEELENLSSPVVNLEVGKMYFGYQPGDDINVDKAIGTIARHYYHRGISLQKACISDKGCGDLPIMDCERKDGIVIISGEKNSYTEDEKCLIISAVDNQELDKLSERVVYQLLGVMS